MCGLIFDDSDPNRHTRYHDMLTEYENLFNFTWNTKIFYNYHHDSLGVRVVLWEKVASIPWMAKIAKACWNVSPQSTYIY